MKVFVWECVERCTNNYHPDGGVVVFAETEARARELANAHPGCHIREDEHPDAWREAVSAEQVFIFPNAGCC